MPHRRRFKTRTTRCIMADLQKLQAVMSEYLQKGADVHQLYQYYNQVMFQHHLQQQHIQFGPKDLSPEKFIKKEESDEPLSSKKDMNDNEMPEMDLDNNDVCDKQEDLKMREPESRRPVVNLERVRHKRQTLQDMARPLKHWLYKHRDNPYPTKSEKMSLAVTSQMTLTQVSNWFANARRRLKNTVRDPELNWESRIKMYNSCVEGNQELLSIDSEESEEEMKEPCLGDTVLDLSSSPAHTVPGEAPCAPIPSPSPASPLPSPKPPQEPAPQPTPRSTANSSSSDLKAEVVNEDHSHPAKYKQCILQRYLTDSYQHSLQQMQQGGMANLGSSRHRNASGSLSSHDFEEMSTSFGGSPMREHQFDDPQEGCDEISRQWTSIENRGEDDLYWKEISAALALTTLARSKFTPSPPLREQCNQ